ncbi:MAG: isopentenyl-diphosphate delta-isomerase, partial [Micrococcales bacterium]
MATDVGAAVEQVVLLGADGKPSGVADKTQVHGADTPLHLAFSVYIFDDRDRVLMTRRALSKPTWPGVWTNSCCGHPAPEEAIEDAVRRRVKHELGFELTDVHSLLPDFGYRAVDDSGVVENEFCPVFWARVPGVAPEPKLNADEVATWAWT